MLITLLCKLHASTVAQVHAHYMTLVPRLQTEIRRAHRSAKRHARAVAKFNSFKFRRLGRLQEGELRELRAGQMMGEDYPYFHNFVYVGTWFDTFTGWAKCVREGCTCVSFTGEPGKYCSRHCRDVGACEHRAHPTPSGLPRVQAGSSSLAPTRRPRRSPTGSRRSSTPTSSPDSGSAGDDKLNAENADFLASYSE